MARWRDVKKGDIKEEPKKTKPKKIEKDDEDNSSSYLISASPLLRIKAFITDMFMIMMPIMYITTYIIMDGSEAFKGSDNAHWVTMAIYGLITVIFWVKKGQTPGFKAYDLRLIDDNTKKPLSFGLAIARYMMFIISAVTIVGAILPFFRKDKKTLQDVIMQTSVVKIN
ncbi:MAG: RDD family protein [Campylobacterota bacterium]|nr:RDD family protein [Campylobacterota bacterium]